MTAPVRSCSDETAIASLCADVPRRSPPRRRATCRTVGDPSRAQRPGDDGPRRPRSAGVGERDRLGDGPGPRAGGPPAGAMASWPRKLDQQTPCDASVRANAAGSGLLPSHESHRQAPPTRCSITARDRGRTPEPAHGVVSHGRYQAACPVHPRSVQAARRRAAWDDGSRAAMTLERQTRHGHCLVSPGCPPSVSRRSRSTGARWPWSPPTARGSSAPPPTRSRWPSRRARSSLGEGPYVEAGRATDADPGAGPARPPYRADPAVALLRPAARTSSTSAPFSPFRSGSARSRRRHARSLSPLERADSTSSHLDQALRTVDQIREALLDGGDPTGSEAPADAQRAVATAQVHQAAGMVMLQANVSIVEAMALLRAAAFAKDVPLARFCPGSGSTTTTSG